MQRVKFATDCAFSKFWLSGNDILLDGRVYYGDKRSQRWQWQWFSGSEGSFLGWLVVIPNGIFLHLNARILNDVTANLNTSDEKTWRQKEVRHWIPSSTPDDIHQVGLNITSKEMTGGAVSKENRDGHRRARVSWDFPFPVRPTQPL